MDQITAISSAIKAAVGVFVLAITGIGILIYTIASVYSLPERVESCRGACRYDVWQD
jgi:hypothetical protein